MVTSKVVKTGRRSLPLGTGQTEADKWFNGLKQKYGEAEARKIWRESSY